DLLGTVGGVIIGTLVSPATSRDSLVARHVPPARSSRPPRIPGVSESEVMATAGRLSHSSRLAATTSGAPGITRDSTTRRHMTRYGNVFPRRSRQDWRQKWCCGNGEANP